MSKDELFRALDRLTRIKHPKFKYKRVFNDIILHHLLEPKLSLKKIEDYDNIALIKYVEIIWNNSVQIHCQKDIKEINFNINNILKEEEKNLYFLNDEDLSLLNININISDLLSLTCDFKNIPLNLKRLFYLKALNSQISTKELRFNKNLKYPIEKIVLCEGLTEEILLPVFADIQEKNFDKFGIHLIPAGGKNQVAKIYYELKDLIKIPIFILLDNDAIEIKQKISPVLKEKDKIYLISSGEFEDIIPISLIEKVFEYYYNNETSVNSEEVTLSIPMTKKIELIMKSHGLGNFKKANFAKKLKEIITPTTPLSNELQSIINLILNKK